MRTVPAIAFLALFTASAAGQRLVYSPDGTTTNEGNANNTIPFWSQSATYMQIHDFANMSPVVGGVPTPILGMVLRKDGGVPRGSPPARSTCRSPSTTPRSTRRAPPSTTPTTWGPTRPSSCPSRR